MHVLLCMIIKAIKRIDIYFMKKAMSRPRHVIIRFQKVFDISTYGGLVRQFQQICRLVLLIMRQPTGRQSR